MIACYCRVSTRRQTNDAQRAEIARWLQGNGIDLGAVRWFEDKDTGQTLTRQAFNELQSAIFSGDVKTIVVWKLDRISRRLQDGLNLLSDWCEKGIRVIVVTQQIDLGGVVGRMVASVLFGLAEIELEYRRERQEAGIRLAKARGVYRGRAIGTSKATPTRAAELRARGLTSEEIATLLGVSLRTVHRYLRHQPK